MMETVPAKVSNVAVMRSWTARQWLVAVLAAVGTALAIGVPTGIIRTSFYHRMTPVLWWNYPIWAASAILEGLVVATFVRATNDVPTAGRSAVGGGLVSLFAVGCPICNKLVVLALGVSGALTWFAPLQPILGIASLLVLGYALRRRLQVAVSCPVRPAELPSVTTGQPETPA